MEKLQIVPSCSKTNLIYQNIDNKLKLFETNTLDFCICNKHEHIEKVTGDQILKRRDPNTSPTCFEMSAIYDKTTSKIIA